jgi:NADH:ubiquinone oxidoreductase subunit B-like Fe-S oxidoreductase
MYNVEDGIDRYIPVDVYVPGCASSPQLIIDALVHSLDILEMKSKEIEKPYRLFGSIETIGNKLSRLNMAKKVQSHEKN